MDIHISFVAEKLFDLGPVQVTNSLLTFIIVFVFLTLGIIILRAILNPLNPSRFELLIEIIYSGIKGLATDILGKNTDKFFAFLFTFFILILFSNWFGLLPIVPAVGILEEKHEAQEEVVLAQAHDEVTDAVTYDSEVLEDETTVTDVVDDHANEDIDNHEEEADTHEDKEESHTTADFGCLISGACFLTIEGIKADKSFVPILRAPSADLSFTLALALISVVVTNGVGLASNKLAFLKRYFDTRGPIEGFVGILELVSEFAKVLSFAFRLFGNIFAGEVLLTVITTITFGVITLPFLGLELFVGVIQALVFFMLTAVFINLAVEHH